MKAKEDYYNLVNLLRGIAILAVISIHVSSVFTELTIKNSTYKTYVFLDIISSFAVPLFLFVSGYVLTIKYFNKSGGIKKSLFYAQRFKKILPSYFVFSLLYIVIIPNFGALGLTGLAKALVSGTSYYHLWFFIILFQFYLIFPALLYLFKIFSKRKTILFIFITLALQILWISFVSNELGLSSKATRNIFLSEIFYYSLGMVFASHYDLLNKYLDKLHLKRFLVISFFVFAYLSYSLYLYPTSFPGWVYLPLFMTELVYCFASLFLNTTIIVLLFGLLPFFYKNKCTKTILVPLSNHSYYIYLIHAMVLYFVLQFGKNYNFFVTSPLYYPLTFLFVTLTSLIFSIFIAASFRFFFSEKKNANPRRP